MGIASHLHLLQALSSFLYMTVTCQSLVGILVSNVRYRISLVLVAWDEQGREPDLCTCIGGRVSGQCVLWTAGDTDLARVWERDCQMTDAFHFGVFLRKGVFQCQRH